MKKIGNKEYFKIEEPFNILYLQKLLDIYTSPYHIKKNEFGEEFAHPIENFGEFKKILKSGGSIYLESNFKEEYKKQRGKLIKIAGNILNYNKVI